ncbi:KxYKxGKxW signal peptide domain-containing protein [Levilactobacillus tongjiangensis]|uniref:KxYKxGKxW signal peptide domain-containing protein n=1 Tax=Levilactobacillus tongjiangensis TaxID=2486023 RepID=A0ABW1SSV5_9LACO|nr:KxYKxGKxW signal peptide domain-containing protein [Levilactobacillus tongjiangensis]
MRFKQLSREGDMKLHYKLFKAGKQLVNAPIGKLALTNVVLFTIALGGVNAYADTAGSIDPTTT